MREIELVELLKAGVHFGHQRSRWHPKMAPYVFTVRNGICIINLEQTADKLRQAMAFAREVVAKGGTVLYVGTKRQAREIILEAARRVSMPLVTERWVGGTFTNFATVSKIITKLTQLKSDRDSGAFGKYTKKERLVIQREIERLEEIIGGISSLEKLPAAVFIVDLKHERTAVREARKLRIPIIALADTNTNPEGIDYPIPANDDASKSIRLITEFITEAIEEGKHEAARRAEVAAREAAEATAKAQAEAAAKTEEISEPIAESSVARLLKDEEEAKP